MQSPVASGGQIPFSPEPPRHGAGPLIGAIVILILLAAGGLYLWGSVLNNQAPEEEIVPYIPSEEVPSAGDSDTMSGLPPQSASDDATAIQADLEAMNFDQFDTQTETDLQNFYTETE